MEKLNMNDYQIADEFKTRALNVITKGQPTKSLSKNSHATMHAAIVLMASEIKESREIMLQITRAKSVEQARELADVFLQIWVRSKSHAASVVHPNHI